VQVASARFQGDKVRATSVIAHAYHIPRSPKFAGLDALPKVDQRGGHSATDAHDVLGVVVRVTVEELVKGRRKRPVNDRKRPILKRPADDLELSRDASVG